MMRRIFITIWVFITFTLITGYAYAQPFIDEIKAFKKQDSLSFPEKHAILFVGSSSFRKWTDVNDYFPGYTIINRGFGGSTLQDVIRYENDIIFPYDPKQIIIYCGENDIAYADTISAEIVFQRFKQLYSDIRQRLPDVPVVFISIKPSPSRWQMKDRMIKANSLIKEYLKKQKHATFVNIWKNMLGPDGKPWDALFIEDNLHMNARGYAIWQKEIKPHLIKD